MGKTSKTVRVPVGIEKLLFCAAKDPELKARLLSDRGRALAEFGGDLEPSEQAMLGAIPDHALEVMIESINPENPWRRSFMGQVAAVASLAAATATVSCAFQTKGADPGPDYDGLPPEGSTTTDSGTDSGTTTDSGTDPGTTTDTGSSADTGVSTASDTSTGSDAGTASDTPTPTNTGSS